MGKIFFFNVSAYGHVNPTIPIALELKLRGHDIVNINYEIMSGLYQENQLNFISYEQISSLFGKKTTICSKLNRIVRSLRMISTSSQDMKSLIQLLARHGEKSQLFDLPLLVLDTIDLLQPTIEFLRIEKPDSVFVDNMCPWPRYAAEILDIPVISSVTTLLSKQEREYTYSLFPEQKYVSELIDRKLSSLRVSAGLPEGQQHELFQCSTTKSIVYTSEKLQGVNTIDEKYKFIGTSLNHANINLSDSDKELLELIQNYCGKVVFLSLGSTIVNKSIYQKLIDYLCNENIMLVVNIGRLNNTDISVNSKNVILRNFLPQIEVLKSSDIVICHGGMNTIHEALYFERPLYIIPFVNDQYVWARRISNNNLGIIGSDKLLSKRTTLENIDHLLSDITIKKAVKETSLSLRSAGGYLTGANLLEGYLKK